jgi:hypothetical protein
MKRWLITFGAAIALVAGVAGVALANSGSFKDPRGDVADHPSHKANYDIIKGTFGDAKHGKVVHTATVAGKVGDPKHPGPNNVFSTVFFDVPRKVGNSYCDYKLQVDPPGTPYNHTSKDKANVYKCKNKPNNPPVGSAQITRKKSNTIKYKLSKKLLGSPRKYGFWLQTIAEGNSGFFVADQAPDKGKIIHKLR